MTLGNAKDIKGEDHVAHSFTVTRTEVLVLILSVNRTLKINNFKPVLPQILKSLMVPNSFS